MAESSAWDVVSGNPWTQSSTAVSEILTSDELAARCDKQMTALGPVVLLPDNRHQDPWDYPIRPMLFAAVVNCYALGVESVCFSAILTAKSLLSLLVSDMRRVRYR